MPFSVLGTSISAPKLIPLRRQTLQNPTVARFAIAQAVVHAVRSLLPEFNLIGMDTIPSPVYGTRHIAVRILGRKLGKAGIQRRPRWDHRALPRGGSRDPAARWTSCKISV